MDILLNMKKYGTEDKIAAIVNEDVLKYDELDKRSNSLARYFINTLGADKRPIVLYGNKENLILIVMMAALKSGRAYVPMDVTFPDNRIEKVLNEVKPEVIINCTDKEKSFEGNVLTINDLEGIFKNYDNADVDPKYWVNEDDNCYILFTSGSTGNPKGVQISKNNLDSFVEIYTKYLEVDNENTAILNQPSYSFDLSVMPIYIGLTNGKKLLSLSKDTLERMNLVFEELRKSDITLWISTPAFAAMCLQDESFDKELMPNIKTMYFIGEVLPSKVVKDLNERFPNVRMINSYGPTEATVAVTGVDITEEILEQNISLPIGNALGDLLIKILDDNGNEVPNGEKGEITIYGKSVSKGYFNNEEVTNKVFFDICDNGNSIRAYRTGDLGYYKDNNLYFCGRKDFQIKLNGYRIELEDIESNIRKVSNIDNVVVVPVEKDDKITHLVAFVVLKEKNGLSNLKNTILIKNELKEFIPAYMIPKNIKVIDEFPTNNNDKIDRKKLLEEL